MATVVLLFFFLSVKKFNKVELVYLFLFSLLYFFEYFFPLFILESAPSSWRLGGRCDDFFLLNFYGVGFSAVVGINKVET